MKEVFINKLDGTVILGQAAVDDFIESSQGYYDITDVSNVFAKNIRIDEVSKNEPLDVEDWAKVDYANYGRWLIGYLSSHGVAKPISHPNLQKAYYLGIGPSSHRVSHRYGSIWQYRESLGQELGRTVNRYKDWDTGDYIAYAQKISDKIGGKPTRKLYEQLAFANKGPSPKSIDTVMGSVGWLNEAIGWPNMKQWDKNDYLQWGLYTMIANNGATLTSSFIEVLGRKHRGPWPRTIEIIFGGIVPYQDRVSELYVNYLQNKETKLSKYKEVISRELCDQDLTGVGNDELLKIMGTYELFKELFKEDGAKISNEGLVNLAKTMPSKSISSIIKKKKPKVSDKDIELTALTLGVYEDIWPYYPPYYPYLGVKPEELSTTHPWYLEHYYKISSRSATDFSAKSNQ